MTSENDTEKIRPFRWCLPRQGVPSRGCRQLGLA